jgi:molybdenum cofactor cytidylyltransferase/nicotine blue oxidoreductase
MGGPKALLRDDHGVPLLDGGCRSATVVLGAAAADARAVLAEAGWDTDDAVAVVVADDWQEGMGASLRAGLTALSGGDAHAALVTLVDLPDVGSDVVRRVVGQGSDRAALVRATYDGRPGHPVLIGREHWAGVVATARGDEGARAYLGTHAPAGCECGDLATGRDLDRPEDR